MHYRLLARFLHLHQAPRLAAEKSLLATLRKKTGYTFTNCKKALELHNNDLKQAEVWLRQQAQSLGWAKATKLEGRQTSQGLIGVTVDKQNAAIVEVNCETDFVARNKEFHRMAEEAALSCLNYSKTAGKVHLTGEELKKLPAAGGKTLEELLVLMIGTVGENASLKRGLCVKSESPDVHLFGYVHPTASGSVLLGKIGALLALRPLTGSEADLETVGKELCQHIVGMNPKKIGGVDDKPAKDKEEESCLIHQEFLLDDSVTVGEVLEESKVEVVDFTRFECGEESTVVEQRLEEVETCQ